MLLRGTVDGSTPVLAVFQTATFRRQTFGMRTLNSRGSDLLNVSGSTLHIVAPLIRVTTLIDVTLGMMVTQHLVQLRTWRGVFRTCAWAAAIQRIS